MSDTSTHLLLPYLLAAQAQKHVTHNEALRLLDGLVQLAVLDRNLLAPPGAPADGDRHIVASGATSLWTGWDGSIAYRVDGAWKRLVINDFDDYRFEDLFQVDLKIGKEFQVSRGIALEVAVDVFNVSNDRAILWRDYEIVPEYNDDDALIATPPTDIEEMQSPRLVRLSGRIQF